MIFMNFISSLGISVAVFSIFAVAVVIFWSSVELQLLKISNWIFFLFILCWGLTGICAAFCHREISSGTFTLVFHLCPVLELAFTGTGLAFCWAIFILFWVVLVSEYFFYRSCLLVADIYLWVAPRIPVSYSSSLTLPLWKRLSWLNQGPTIDSMVLPSLPFHRWEVAVTQLFVMPPPGASIVELSSWPSPCSKCTSTRNIVKSSTSVLFAQRPSSLPKAPWLTWPASTQQSLTRLLSKCFGFILLLYWVAPGFPLSLTVFFFCFWFLSLYKRSAALFASRGLFQTRACLGTNTVFWVGGEYFGQARAKHP